MRLLLFLYAFLYIFDLCKMFGSSNKKNIYFTHLNIYYASVILLKSAFIFNDNIYLRKTKKN